MKTIIFFLFFISLTFFVKASVQDSVYYTQDKEHFLIKTTILKQDYSIETDSSGVIVESYRNIISHEKLSKLPEEFWEYNNTYLNYLIKSKVGKHIYVFGATFLNGYFSMKENSYLFDENKERFIEKTKDARDSYAFLLSFLMLFLTISSGAFMYQEIKFFSILKNLYSSTADQAAKLLSTGFFLLGIFCFIGLYFIFPKELYI